MAEFQGAIFEVDGVRVDSPHEKAWRESLRELMESSWRGIRDRTTWSPDGFTSHVYRQYISGKPRASGARAALDYFQVPTTALGEGRLATRKALCRKTTAPRWYWATVRGSPQPTPPSATCTD